MVSYSCRATTEEIWSVQKYSPVRAAIDCHYTSWSARNSFFFFSLPFLFKISFWQVQSTWNVWPWDLSSISAQDYLLTSDAYRTHFKKYFLWILLLWGVIWRLAKDKHSGCFWRKRSPCDYRAVSSNSFSRKLLEKVITIWTPQRL